MKSFTAIGAVAAALTLGAGPANAAVVLLDFTNAPCSASGTLCAISQAYGDQAGVDVSYDTVSVATGEATSSAFYWSGKYGDLDKVLYAGADARNAYGEVVLRAANGYKLSLLDFDYAGFGGARNAPFKILDLAGNVLTSFTGSTTAGGHESASINTAYLDGVVLRWGPDSYNVALDNIRFDLQAPAVSAAPEPAGWALMLAGFGGMGAMLRARRRSLAV
ncbi:MULTISPECIES: PEP-CTERM sorting domain-containing protein [unclassified Phenylobacterium]|uniref:PEP-CTERM sorting domain-containing protein n=1 Tax=unclassified Phenylobacterium TaxID=2640670 RepID=UPI00083AA8E5|nr:MULTISPECIES: PEP-CTERM sorting domain-containing protein [unclassified Phenylobacterium]